MLMSFLVDDYTFNVDQKLPAEEKAPVSYPNTLPESFTKYGLQGGGAGAAVVQGRPWCRGGTVAGGGLLQGWVGVGVGAQAGLMAPGAQVFAGAAHGLRGGAVLRPAYHQAEEQECAPPPAAGAG